MWCALKRNRFEFFRGFLGGFDPAAGSNPYEGYGVGYILCYTSKVRKARYMDYVIFQWFHGFAGRFPMLDWFAWFAAEAILVLASVFLVIWFFFNLAYRKKDFIPLFALFAGIGGKAVSLIFDIFLFFPRPFELLGFTPLAPMDPNASSFPSGHASYMFAITFYLLLANRKESKGARFTGWIFLGLAVIVGLARIYVGVHWPLDIVGGILAGLLAGSFLALITSKGERSSFGVS
jgi:undecaprenyl-diphosphatase